jgi:DNA transposition AAA+ family ATPase
MVLSQKTQKALWKLISKSGMSQTSFSIRLKVGQASMNHYLHGRRRPNYKTAMDLVAMAEELGVDLSMDDLLAFGGEVVEDGG